MAAYYNEHDPKMAAWLRALIAARLIADGDVDGRSIVDVRPGDLADYTQCHFFAGIGGWSYALRLADWNDTRPCWTGSCPCQPFSAAGKGDGTADPRHLWPAWFQLVRQCRPAVVFGEQVASADGLGWLDRVSTDLEGADYAIGAADLCAPCVGAFDIRQRLWFVAESCGAGTRRNTGGLSPAQPTSRQWNGTTSSRCAVGELADGHKGRLEKFSASRLHDHWESGHDIAGCGTANELGHTDDSGPQRRRCAVLPERASERPTRQAGDAGWLGIADGDNAAEECKGDGIVGGQRATERRRQQQHAGAGAAGRNGGGSCAEGTPARGHGNDTAAARSFWAATEWIPCTDGKWRPVEPGTFPLAHGVPARVGRLRGYGNAIKPQVAALFIRAYRDVVE